jgi:hypothetical protein
LQYRVSTNPSREPLSLDNWSSLANSAGLDAQKS